MTKLLKVMCLKYSLLFNTVSQLTVDMKSIALNPLAFTAEKYWKKYQYATKFVQLVKSKTPKVTLFTKFAKCMLMENTPNADLEVCFYDGEQHG